MRKNANAFHSLDELHRGDYVVHVAHGIGVFEGINKLEASGTIKDYIKIRYDKGDILYVPVTQLDQVSKYIGPSGDDKPVRLNKLGGKAVEALVGPKAKALRDSIVMVGTMVIGAVGATWVSITCSPNLVLPGGGKFQDTLDGIYPHLLPMIFIIFCWYMMTKKKVNPIVMMLILVVIAFVGVLIGFFDPALSY